MKRTSLLAAAATAALFVATGPPAMATVSENSPVLDDIIDTHGAGPPEFSLGDIGTGGLLDRGESIERFMFVLIVRELPAIESNINDFYTFNIADIGAQAAPAGYVPAAPGLTRTDGLAAMNGIGGSFDGLIDTESVMKVGAANLTNTYGAPGSKANGNLGNGDGFWPSTLGGVAAMNGAGGYLIIDFETIVIGAAANFDYGGKNLPGIDGMDLFDPYNGVPTVAMTEDNFNLMTWDAGPLLL